MEGKALELLGLTLAEGDCPMQRNAHSLCPRERDVIHAIRKELENRFSSPPTLAELAEDYHMGVHKIQVGFKELYGASVFGFIKEYKLQKAKMYFEEGDMNVSEVAWAIGYINLSHFSTAYRKRFGVLPKAYLKSIRAIPTPYGSCFLTESAWFSIPGTTVDRHGCMPVFWGADFSFQGQNYLLRGQKLFAANHRLHLHQNVEKCGALSDADERRPVERIQFWIRKSFCFRRCVKEQAMKSMPVCDGRGDSTAKKMFLLASMYLCQAIPLGYVFGSLPVIMRESRMSLEGIGGLFILHLPWAFKFIYASWVDKTYFPALGRRRSWIFPLQWVGACLLLIASQTPPETQYGAMYAVLMLLNIVMATNDIAVDGYATDILKPSERRWGTPCRPVRGMWA